MHFTTAFPLLFLRLTHLTTSSTIPSLSTRQTDTSTNLPATCLSPTTSPTITNATLTTTLTLFCIEHQGTPIASEGNYTTGYDTNGTSSDDAGKRVHFTVTSVCAPNGIYLPLPLCEEGFGAVAGGCLLDEKTAEGKEGDEKCERTAGGRARVQCLDFELRVALGE